MRFMLRFTGVAILSAVGGREWRNGEWMGAKGAAGNPAAPQAVKKPTESSRGPKPSRTSIVLSDMRGEHGRILSQGNLISRRENSYLADFAAGVRRTQAKSARLKILWIFRFRQRRNCHGSNRRFEARHLAGELAPLPTSLSK